MITQNVTAKVDSEICGELVESKSSLADSILEQIADAVIYADETGTIRRWNSAAAVLFGYDAAEALGQNLDIIIP
ncbi:MAG: PAS domain-containing protein, partial [Xanthobacteraceae bacterium]